MLSALIRSWAELEKPPNVDVFFVVIENHPEASTAQMARSLAATLNLEDVVFEIEPEVGIPFARNKAVAVALDRNADLILFVDDDERVTPTWLREMLRSYVNGQEMLIGGPVKVQFSEPHADKWRAIVRNGIVARYERVARKAKRYFDLGLQDRIAIITNNWLADARLFTEHNLSFDTSLRFTGGEDTRFYRDVKRCGLPTGWSPNAIIYETLPKERQTLKYQFRQSMEQSKTSFNAKLREMGYLLPTIRLTGDIAIRLIILIPILISLPFRVGAATVQIVRGLGWLAGRFAALFGSVSNLYRTTTGD